MEPISTIIKNILSQINQIQTITMNYQISEGVYSVQSGHRKDIALVKCPYESNRIQVYDAHGLKILHGAEVYWTEIRRYKKRRQTIIQAVILGLKSCQYINHGKEVICTLKVCSSLGIEKGKVVIKALPIQSKLPFLSIVNSGSLLENFQTSEQNDNFNQKVRMIQKKYFWVRILGWDYNSDLPYAVVTSIFHQNDAKTTEAETQVILNRLEIKGKFDGENLKNINFQVVSQEDEHQLPIKGHKEFNQMVFTIDPQNSMDIEDGLSLKILKNNQNSNHIYEVGVHISDVTSYSHLFENQRDQIAERGTSVYLPHKVIHMLPQNIVKMCRLAPNKLRLAFSVFFKIDTEGNLVQSPSFSKNIVRSCAKLSYEEAEDMINKQKQNINYLIQKHKLNENQFDLLIEKIRVLKKIAFLRRKNRLKFRGVTEMFGRNQVTFKLDETNFPIEIGLKKRLQSEKLIEQFMIMANQSVAKKLVKDYGENSLVIYHPQPSQYSISHLNDIFSDFGVKFTTDNVVDMEKQIEDLLGKEGIKDQVKQLLIIRAMQIQQHATYTRYLNSSKGHFGLNLQCYTHFTSPLRRFADIVVHEQLQQCLINKQQKRAKGWGLQKFIKQIDLANKARFRNKRLKQTIVECFINMMLHRQDKTIKGKALILSLGLKSATIYVPIYNIIKQVQWEGKVQYSEKDTIKVIEQQRQISNGVFDKIYHELHRNDSIDIEIMSQNHQQVKIKIVFQNDK